MAPGDCALQYLNMSDKGFSNSPHLSGNYTSSGPNVRHWTGARHFGRSRSDLSLSLEPLHSTGVYV